MHNLINNIRKSLSDYYPDSETSVFIRLIIEHVTKSSYPLLLLDKSTKITKPQFVEIEKIVNRLKTFEPIQYIMGYTEFYGSIFNVDKNVLIPRQETEELVELIISDNRSFDNQSLLDIGTGSGCIAISLKKEMIKSEIEAWDISAKALNIANLNSKLNEVDILFKEVDILADYPTTSKFNIIVSNPPYILDKEKTDMDKNVLDFEPHNALFVPNEAPLLFYERIADIAKELLYDNGLLYFEINRQMGFETCSMLKCKQFKNVEIIKDISNNDRIVKAQFSRI